MYLEQLYTGCLAEAAYYIESNGEAVIIDPLRETDPYIEKAKERNAKIKYIFETHFHADFVSGHVDLANKTGATIVYGPTATTGYEAHIAKDNEEFKVGDITIKVLHTPGHTMESSTFLLLDENGVEKAIFSGDTLFIGDVGRPDLAIKSDLTQEDLAGLLYDSLRNKIMTLPDDVIVYPAHGAGSACGKNMSSETFDSLGNQKAMNYALRADMSKEEFIKEVTEGILPPPQYFPKNAMMNKTGYENIDNVMEKGVHSLSVEQVKGEVNRGALVIDTRKQEAFKSGFIPGSLFFGLDGNYATWVGALVEDLDHKIILITEEGREGEAVKRLARVGYDNTIGYLKGGVEAWKAGGESLDVIESISPEELSKSWKGKTIIDVRKPGEFSAEHVEDAISRPLDFIGENWDDYDNDHEYYVHCKGGYRSLIACSILRRNGIKNLVDVEKGFDGLLEAGIPTTDYVCPSTL